jgi:hypothetical protein
MARVSKRPPLIVSDETRVPVPGLVPKNHNYATYTVTPLGHIYRDDGRLLTPTADGWIKFNGGRNSRTLARVVFLAFGRPELVAGWRVKEKDVLINGTPHDVWVDPRGPTDELTGRLRCTVHDVKLVPHGELIKFGRRSEIPKTQIPII